MEEKVYEFGKPISEIIKKRSSIRTYQKKLLEPHIKNKLMTFADSIKGPFNLDIRFIMLDITSDMTMSGIKLGTYGVIKGAKSFIAAALSKNDKAMEELGYCFEKLILYAESLGIGTCWMGGTFKKSQFAKAAKMKEHEIMPIVTPVGYQSDNKSFTETLMRLGAGSNKRKSWNEIFFYETFGKELTRQEAGVYELPLEMIRLAPSASNKQPWRILKKGSDYIFYLQHTKGYASALGYDIQKIDIGIAMCHFEMTAKEIGLQGQWSVNDPKIKNIPDACEYIISWVTEQN